MHELSIALNIIEIAELKLAQHGGRRVRAVHLRVGPQAAIAKEALLFSFGLACESTPLEGASLLFEDAEGHDLQIVRMEIE